MNDRNARGQFTEGNRAGVQFGSGAHTLCGAYARSTGKPCRKVAMANGRCRNHGGCSTGPKTESGKQRQRAAATIHGGYAGPGNPINDGEPGAFWLEREHAAEMRQARVHWRKADRILRRAKARGELD